MNLSKHHMMMAVYYLLFYLQKMHPRCICDVCDFMAEHAYVIKRHMMRHNADGCRCDICGKVYKVSMLPPVNSGIPFECQTDWIQIRPDVSWARSVSNPNELINLLHCKKIQPPQKRGTFESNFILAIQISFTHHRQP